MVLALLALAQWKVVLVGVLIAGSITLKMKLDEEWFPFVSALAVEVPFVRRETIRCGVGWRFVTPSPVL